MKIPEPTKLPSGSWTVRVMIDGQRISITKPTKKACIAEAAALKTGVKEAEKKSKKKTVTQAIEDYIDARRNICSPATIRSYKKYQKLRFQSMMNKDIFKVTPEQWQRAVNLEAKAISAKTLKSTWGFLSSVITETTGNHVSVRLPQVIPPQKAWLRPEQIPVFVELVKDDPIEIPALLALSSLRRSELLALRWEDIDLTSDVLYVNGAAVFDEEERLVRKKETKNTSSRRTVPIIQPLHEALEKAERNGDYVVTWYPNSIACRINRLCDQNNLPHVGLHGLRHSFASLGKHLGMPEDAVMRIGGWSDFQTMRKIYTHISEADMARHTNGFTDFFANKEVTTVKNGNENGNAK